MTPAFSETMLLGCFRVGPVVPVREGNIGSLKNSMKCVMSWHSILSGVCAASGWKASICQGPPVANLPLHTLCWAHSPAAWIIQHPCTDVSPHWTLFSRRKMSCSARQTARAYLSVSSSGCLTALLPLSLIIHTLCCSSVLFRWLSGEMGCGK